MVPDIRSFTNSKHSPNHALHVETLAKEGVDTAEQIERFTVGRDRELDLHLAPFDVLGSLAHAHMLETIGLISNDELGMMNDELKIIYQQIQNGQLGLKRVWRTFTRRWN